MKRFLVLVLMLTVVLSTSGFAEAAPADVTGTEYEEAVTKLNAIGVMKGDDKGFRPYDAVTRAEFSVLVVRILGLEAAARFSTSPTKFADVTNAYQWAWGYINVATEQGIIKGYSDTTFGPGDPVTYEQAITMIVRALGYEPAVVGGYPAGYLAKAAELDITDDVKVTSGIGATRGAVAQMLANSLLVPMMERTTFGDTVEYTVPANPKNLLENKIGVKIIGVGAGDSGRVVSIDLKGNEIKIDNKKYDAVEGLIYNGLEGASVTAWELDDELVYLEVESSVIYDYVAGADTRKNEIEFKVLDEVYEYDSRRVSDEDAENAVGKFVKAVLNEDDEIISLEVYNLALRGFVTEVNDDNIEYKNPEGNERRYRFEENDITVVIDGVVAKLYDIEKDDLLYTDGDLLVVSTARVRGRFDRARANEFRIDGDYYDVSARLYLSLDDGKTYYADNPGDREDLLGETVVAYFDYKGDIAFMKGDVEEDTSVFYAVVVAKANAGFDTLIKVVKDDGTAATLALDIDDKEAVIAGGVYELELDSDGYVIEAYKKADLNIVDKSDPANGIEDEIEKFFKRVTSHSDEVIKTTRVYYITKDTRFFNLEDFISVDDNDTPDDITDDKVVLSKDTDDIEVVEWDDIRDAKSVTSLVVHVTANVKGEAEVVLIYEGLGDIGDDETYYAVVVDKAKVSRDEYAVEVDNGEEITEILFDEDDADRFDVDDVITYRLAVDGTATKVMVKAHDISGKITDIDGYFIQVDNSDYYKVYMDAAIYEIIQGDYDKKADLGDLDIGDKVFLYVDNYGIVRVVQFRSIPVVK